MPKYPLPWEEGGDAPHSQSDPPIIVYPEGFRDKAKSRFDNIRYHSDFVPFTVIIAGIIGFIFLIWLIWFLAFRTEPQSATINSKYWERSISIERFQTIDDRDWRGQEPADARIYDERREIHHYDTEYYDCSGLEYNYNTGQYEYKIKQCSRQEPVYRTRVYYNVDRWRHDYWIPTQGKDIRDSEFNKPPYWADAPSNVDNRPILGNIRVGNLTKEYYSAEIVCNECTGDNTVEIKLSEWNKYKVGAAVIADVQRDGDVRRFYFEHEKSN